MKLSDSIALKNPENQSLPKALLEFEHIQRCWIHQHRVFAARIRPGECFVTHSGEMIVTVLGSCISACIRDPQLGIGGMNHFMLPDEGREVLGGKKDINTGLAARYGNFAMEYLINTIIKYGGKRERLEIKIFGGAHMLNSKTDVGQCNISFVRHYLRTEGLLATTKDIGDIYPRKVLYFPDTGRVLVKKLRWDDRAKVIQDEMRYLQDLEQKPKEGGIELF